MPTNVRPTPRGGAINGRQIELEDELAEGQHAVAAKRRIGPFRESFPDFEMEIVDLAGEGHIVVAHSNLYVSTVT